MRNGLIVRRRRKRSLVGVDPGEPLRTAYLVLRGRPINIGAPVEYTAFREVLIERNNAFRDLEALRSRQHWCEHRINDLELEVIRLNEVIQTMRRALKNVKREAVTA